MKKPALSLDALEPFFDKIEKLSKLYRLLISVGIFLIFIAAAVFLFYMPKYKSRWPTLARARMLRLTKS